MDNKIEKTSIHLCVTFDGIIEKTGMCIRSLLGRGPLPLEVIFKTKGILISKVRLKKARLKRLTMIF
jgi:hypothetical protein